MHVSDDGYQFPLDLVIRASSPVVESRAVDSALMHVRDEVGSLNKAAVLRRNEVNGVQNRPERSWSVTGCWPALEAVEVSSVLGLALNLIGDHENELTLLCCESVHLFENVLKNNLVGVMGARSVPSSQTLFVHAPDDHTYLGAGESVERVAVYADSGANHVPHRRPIALAVNQIDAMQLGLERDPIARGSRRNYLVEFGRPETGSLSRSR